MSASSAIGKVGLSLCQMLKKQMQLGDKVDVTLLSPDEQRPSTRANLFLYKVQENALLRNLDWQLKPNAPTRLTPPPLSLNLFYLLTAYAKSEATLDNSTAHEILGEAMRALYENPIVPVQHLDDKLLDAAEFIKIWLVPTDMEELSRIWSSFSKAFRPSVMYEVSVVQIDMLQGHERVLAKRVREVVPIVEAPYVPPVLTHIAPARGLAGSTITVFGKHLAGWQGKASLSIGKPITVAEAHDDHYALTLPNELATGLYELRVDVAHLCRRTFFFEVLAA